MNKPLSKKDRIKQKQQDKLREKEEDEQLQKNKKQTQNKKANNEACLLNKSTRSEPEIKQNSEVNKKKEKPEKESKKLKKPVQQQQSEESSEDQQQNLDFNNVMNDQENLQFSFLISEINEKHYHSMKTILQKFSRLTGVISSEWADAIIGNAKAGNVVVADDADEDDDQQEQSGEQAEEEEDDEDNTCSGVINILPSSHKLTKKLVTKISQSVQGKQGKYHGSKKPTEILGKSDCSLLICERAINLPAVIVKSMHEVLLGDLQQLRQEKPEEYAKICSPYMLGLSEVEIPRGSKPEELSAEDIVFSRFEDYLFLQNSECWWVGEGSPNSLRKAPLHKLYYIIRSQKYLQGVAQIHSLLEEE